MLNIIMFGPPGSGKGTQSQQILKQYGLIHLSTGEMLRYEMDNKTKIGEEIRKGMDNGEYVSDELALQLIKQRIERQHEPKGFVFDGFPRTLNQAEKLDELLNGMGEQINLMFSLEVSEKELVSRLMERAKISGRGEDQGIEVIQKRLGIYHKKTKPVKDYYKAKKKLQAIDGLGSVEDIFNRIKKKISNTNI